MKEKGAIKRKFEGVVVSDKAQKSRIVEVTRLAKHPRYHKYRKVTKRFAVHDEGNAYKKGDVVVIEETRPISRTKRWKIIQKVEDKKKNL